MRLATESSFNHVADQGEGTRVGRVLESMEDGGSGLVGKIEFPGGVRSDVVRYHAVDLGPKRLYGDYIIHQNGPLRGFGNRKGGVHDCHFKPICAFASSTESMALRLELAMPENSDCLSN